MPRTRDAIRPLKPKIQVETGKCCGARIRCIVCGFRGRADVVYGSRLRGGKPVRDFSLLYLWGNKFVTFMTNLLYRAALTDMETGYKVFRADVIKNIQVRANRFDFEPEITAKVLKRGHKLVELPIAYYGRPHSEGKKLTWRDGFRALWTLLKYRFID